MHRVVKSLVASALVLAQLVLLTFSAPKLSSTSSDHGACSPSGCCPPAKVCCCVASSEAALPNPNAAPLPSNSAFASPDFLWLKLSAALAPQSPECLGFRSASTVSPGITHEHPLFVRFRALLI